jgi:hypothetical protein
MLNEITLRFGVNAADFLYKKLLAKQKYLLYVGNSTPLGVLCTVKCKRNYWDNL